MVDESCRRVEHRLQTSYQVGWNADQYCIAVEPLQASVTCLQSAPLGGSGAISGEQRSTATPFVWRAPASTSLHQCKCRDHGRTAPEWLGCQRSVSQRLVVDDDADLLYSRWLRICPGSASACSTSPSPQCHLVVGNLRWDRVDRSRRTWAIEFNVISIEVWQQSMAFDQLDQDLQCRGRRRPGR